jgi:hypothetical protein
MNDKIETIEQQLQKALGRITELEKKLREVDSGHWNAIVGQEIILKRLVILG